MSGAEPIELVTDHAAGTPWTGPLLEVRDLCVTFSTDDGPVMAVDHVSFTLEEGETLGIVGESGSGKSVTSMAILGLLPRQATVTGSVRYRGRELVGLKEKELQPLRGQHLAMVFQDALTALNPVHKVGAQIAEAISVHQTISDADLKTRVIELLELVGIPNPSERAEQYPHEYSGGMRQRAMIAMSIANEPDVLIADEPTTALDVTIQAQVLEVFERIQDRTRSSILLITHDLGVVAENCTRVIVMYAGEVVEEATTVELFARAHHPYTEGLLGAMPKVGGNEERLATIPGTVPPPTAWPLGCRFRERCAYAWERCEREHPPLYQIGAGHTSRCHLADEPERRANPHAPIAAQRGATAA